MYERLLVPLDGSRLAEAVLPIAEALGSALGVTLVLVHVVERAAPPKVHGEQHLTNVAEAEAYLAGIADRLIQRRCRVEAHVHEVEVGNVAVSLAEHAEEQQTDLVLLSTHGHGGMREVLWGSIAQQVLQQSSKPTLLVQAREAKEPQPFAPESIMVPLDATKEAEAAIPHATYLARGLGSQIRLLMVVATLETVAGENVPAATYLPSTIKAALNEQERQATTYLERLASSIRSEGVEAIAEVRRGNPVRQLAVDTAEHEDGLVVVATHGRAGLQAIWSSSVAARLIRRTSVPLLLIPITE